MGKLRFIVFVPFSRFHHFLRPLRVFHCACSFHCWQKQRSSFVISAVATATTITLWEILVLILCLAYDEHILLQSLSLPKNKSNA